MKKIINLGEGKYVISNGKYEGLPCVFIELAKKQGKVGEMAGEESGINTGTLEDNSVIIQFGNNESAQVLVEEINKSL